MTPMINMDADLKDIQTSLRAIVKAQIETPTGETQMYFDHIHLSPLKVFIEDLYKFLT